MSTIYHVRWSDHRECERCGMTRMAGHPIQACYGCDRAGYDRAMSELISKLRAKETYVLGVCPYADALYVWADGIVVGVEGRLDKLLRVRRVDDLVAKLTAVEAENKDLLAENARLRRRLESKPVREGGTE